MIRYFYDKVADTLIALDDGTMTIKQLPALKLPSNAPASMDEAPQLASKRKYTKRGSIDAEVLPTRKSKGKGCEECGSTTRHRKECSNAKTTLRAPKLSEKGNDAWQALEGPRSTKTAALSRMQFSRIQLAHSHDIPPNSIAANMDVPEQEVNKAILAETYDDYCK
jgi:hypothetical protein